MERRIRWPRHRPVEVGLDVYKRQVERLLPEAEVYITDWANAREVPMEAGDFDLDTYADYVAHFIEMLGPDTNVIAVCQSTVPSVMAVARIAEDKPCLLYTSRCV